MEVPALMTQEKKTIIPRLLLLTLFTILVLSRLWNLDYQAFHHDESIHSVAIWKIARQGPVAYSYDPVYHGPFFYYLGAVFSACLPDTDFTARLPFAVAGILLVVACLPLALLLGRSFAMILSVLLILSPTVTYYSRFAREDVVTAALLAWVIASGALYIKTKKLRWLTVAWVFMVLGYCTKENSYINWFVVCSFVMFLGIWSFFRDRRHGKRLIFVDYLPLTRLLLLFGIFSFFVFLFVAIDVRVSPDTPLLKGMSNIVRSSVSLSRETAAMSAKNVLLDEHGYFTHPGRESIYQYYKFSVILFTVLVLAWVEFMSARCLGFTRETSLTRCGSAALGYGVAAVWLWYFYNWASGFSGPMFLSNLLHRLISGWLLLSGVAAMAVVFVTAARYRFREIDKRLLIIFRLCRPQLATVWTLVIQILLAIGIYCLLFSSFGKNVPDGLHSGLYDYVGYWLRQQTGEYRIWSEWWYYIPRLALYEFTPLLFITVFGTSLLFRRKIAPEPLLQKMTLFAVWLTIAMIVAYALLNEKVGWLAIYQSYALSLLAALIFIKWINVTTSRWARFAAGIFVIAAIGFTCLQHSLAVHLYPDSPTEPMAFVTTSSGYLREVKRVEGAHWEAVERNTKPPLIAMSGEGVWPAAWYLRRLQTTTDPLAHDAAIRILDDTAENRRRIRVGSDYVWRIRPAMVRGWWFSHGEGLPAGGSLFKNLYALAVNAPNDHHNAFSPDDPAPDNYASRFAAQLWRFIFFRTPWYPITGTPVVFAWRTNMERERRSDIIWLDGFFREARDSTIVDRIGMKDNLQSPRAVSFLESGNLAVVDSGNGRICIFNTKGDLLQLIGKGVLSENETGPCGMSEGQGGNIYVTDTWNHALRLFSSTGELLASCSGFPEVVEKPNLYGPRGIAAARHGDSLRVYATDTGNNRVLLLDAMLRPIMTWGKPGDKAGEFNEPVGIVVDDEGWVYVADTGNGRIQQFGPDGGYVQEFPVFIPEDYERLTAEPQLSLLPDGRRIAMTFATRGIFVVISPDTHEAWPWKPSGESVEPSGIAFSPQWDLYMTDRRSGTVLRLLENGNVNP